MSNTSLQADAARGDRARVILNDPLVNEAFTKMDEEIVAAWRNSAADDNDSRYNAFLMQRLLRNLKHQFELMIASGAIARAKLLEIEEDS